MKRSVTNEHGGSNEIVYTLEQQYPYTRKCLLWPCADSCTVMWFRPVTCFDKSGSRENRSDHHGGNQQRQPHPSLEGSQEIERRTWRELYQNGRWFFRVWIKEIYPPASAVCHWYRWDSHIGILKYINQLADVSFAGSKSSFFNQECWYHYTLLLRVDLHVLCCYALLISVK